VQACLLRELALRGRQPVLALVDDSRRQLEELAPSPFRGTGE
jgi:hypothetical protein